MNPVGEQSDIFSQLKNPPKGMLNDVLHELSPESPWLVFINGGNVEQVKRFNEAVMRFLTQLDSQLGLEN